MDRVSEHHRESVDHDSLLCLLCRESGHLAGNCCNELWGAMRSYLDWNVSARRKSLIEHLRTIPISGVCPRCQNLDLIQLLREEIPWNTPLEMVTALAKRHPLFKALGQARSVEFRRWCKVCVCLFSLTPPPTTASDLLCICPDWTWTYFGAFEAPSLHCDQTQTYAKLLRVVADTPEGLNSRQWGPDAICIREDSLSSHEILGGREIQTHSFNASLCKRWLHSCHALHGQACAPTFADELMGIRLVDVHARIIVAYPGARCEYAALSYVWGATKQKSYLLGSQLPALPRTVEDAIACTKELGLQYLWVDSVCIDQDDETDKADQMTRMQSIYAGSYVTLVALSSKSADQGLSGFSSNAPRFPQLSCTIDGTHLVSLNQSLNIASDVSKWGLRAWTLQEQYCSHRCLYLSDEQLYFKCQISEACEALDESRMREVSSNDAVFDDLRGSPKGVKQHTSSTVPFRPALGLRNRLEEFFEQLKNYTARKMTYDQDALRAFSAILQRLQLVYTTGFFWGHPLEDFQWSLLRTNLSRPRRRLRFPSWSWAATDAHTDYPEPDDLGNPHQSPIPFRAWKFSNGRLILLFDAIERAAAIEQPGRPIGSTIESSSSDRDPGNAAGHLRAWPRDIAGRFSLAHEGIVDLQQAFEPQGFVGAEDFALFVETWTMQIQPDLESILDPRHELDLKRSAIRIAQVTCVIFHGCSYTRRLQRLATHASVKYLWLAANVHEDEHYQLHILALLNEGNHYTRAFAMILGVPFTKIDVVLSELRLRREHLVLF